MSEPGSTHDRANIAEPEVGYRVKMAVQQRQWGTTPSISWTLPTEKEIVQDEELTDELKRQGQYEAPGETQKKQQLLIQLQKIAVEFVKHVCRKNNMPESIINSAGGKIFTYGSYRLGAYAPGTVVRIANGTLEMLTNFRIRYRYIGSSTTSCHSRGFL